MTTNFMIWMVVITSVLVGLCVFAIRVLIVVDRKLDSLGRRIANERAADDGGM